MHFLELIIIKLFLSLSLSLRNIRHTFKVILKEEGGFWSGALYRGIVPTAMVKNDATAAVHLVIGFLCNRALLLTLDLILQSMKR